MSNSYSSNVTLILILDGQSLSLSHTGSKFFIVRNSTRAFKACNAELVITVDKSVRSELVFLPDGIRIGEYQKVPYQRKGLNAMLDQEIERSFTYHPPKQGQAQRYEAIRQKAKELAILINEECVPSREKSLAITNVEQSVFWANSSIARHETQGRPKGSDE